jgi:hypothetical protein
MQPDFLQCLSNWSTKLPTPKETLDAPQFSVKVRNTQSMPILIGKNIETITETGGINYAGRNRIERAKSN